MNAILRNAGLALACQIGLASAAFAAPISGAINPDGTQQTHSTAYTVSHPSTGHYIITFKKPLTPAASCIFNALADDRPVSLGENSTVCDVTFGHFGTGTPENVQWNFVAVVMSH